MASNLEQVDLPNLQEKKYSSRGEKHNQSFACYGLASAYLDQGQYEAALRNANEAVKLAEDIGDHWFGAYCHIELGNVHRTMGQYAEAERHYRKSLRIKKDYKDPKGIAVAAKHLGEISLLQHDYRAARSDGDGKPGLGAAAGYVAWLSGVDCSSYLVDSP